jgi:TPR repeat protein
MKFHSKKNRLSGVPAILLTIAIATANLYAFPDFEQAKSGADAGEADAQAIAATYYALGWQTEKNPEAAIQYAEQSSQSGNPLGKFRLGAMMRNGEGIPKDEPRGLSLQSEAVKIWSQDFDEEDPFSLTALGVALFQGKALPQDKALAAKFYKKAADLDFAPAQYNYAMCAKLGEGIPKDPSLSQKYLQKAAQNGYRLANEALGQPASTPSAASESTSTHKNKSPEPPKYKPSKYQTDL